MSGSREPRAAPLVALLTRWAMLRARQGRAVPGGVFVLLTCLAERFNHARGYAFPGEETLSRDLGITARGLRLRLRTAEQLGAITVRIGRGRGQASEMRFTDEVWTAPSLEDLAYMDGRTFPQKRNARSAFPQEERGTLQSEKGNAEVAKRGTGVPPYRCSTADVPLLRPSAASVSSTCGKPSTNGNGALTTVDEGRPLPEATPPEHVQPARRTDPLPRIEQFRQVLAGCGPQHAPMSEAQEAERRRFLAEQKESLLREPALLGRELKAGGAV